MTIAPNKRLSLILLTILFFSFQPIFSSEIKVNFAPAQLNFNPQYGYTTTEAQIFTALYEGLVSYNPQTLKPEPALAESWSISADKKTYTFHLRKNLQWSNGSKIRAQDIRRSWLNLLDPKNKAPYASLLDIIEKDDNEGLKIRVPDENTFIVTLKSPTPYFLQILCHHSFVPLHTNYRYFKKWDDPKNVPLNGPYQFDSKPTPNQIILKKRDEYWDSQNVKIDRIIIEFSNDQIELEKEYRNNKIDWIESGWYSALGDPSRFQLNPLFSTSYFYFNNRQTPWENPLIRRAIALLIPWGEVRQNEFIPATTLIPRFMNYPKPKGLNEANTQEALSLFKKAGYPNGEGLPPLVFRLPYKSSKATDIMIRAISDNSKIKVEYDFVPFDQYYDSLKKDDFAIGQITWTGDYADPTTFLNMWISGSTLNDAHFSSPEYDALLLNKKGDNRLKKLSQGESILLESAQVMPLSHTPAINLLDLRFISGWYPNILNIHPFKYLNLRFDYEVPGTI